MQYCQACGYTNLVGVVTCARCGASALPATVMPAGYYVPPPPPRQRSRVMPALLITSSVIIGLIILAVGGLIAIGVSVAAKEKAEAAARRQAEILGITSVREQDGTLNRSMKSDIQSIKPATDADFDGLTGRIDVYVSDARKIDTSGCPRDYAETYSRYLSAWSEEAEAIRAHPHVPTEGEAFVEGFFRGLAGDPTGAVVQRQDEFKSWLKEVKEKDAATQREADAAQALAIRYGA